MKKIWGIPDDRRRARSALGAAFVLMAFGTGTAFAEGDNQPQPKGGPAEVKALRAEAKGEAPGKSAEAKAKVAEVKAEKADKADASDKDEKAEKKDKAKKADKKEKSPAARADQARERLLAAADAVAKDSDGEPDPKVRAERRAARRAYMKAQIELRQKAAKGEKDEKKPSLSAEQKAELKAKADALAEERKKGAEKRIAEQKAQLKKAYSDSHLFRPIRNELRRHAWRVARLERAQDVAKATERADLAERATKLLADEQTRHSERMKQLVEVWKAAGKPKGEPFTAPGAKPAAPGATGAAASPTPKPPTPTPAASKPAEGN